MRRAGRSCGILLPIASLPSPCGIGAFSKEAYAFIDFLKAAGQKYWQILPLCPTGFGDSPYQSFSTFAGNPYFIDPETLIAEGLLTKREVTKAHEGMDRKKRVDYVKLHDIRPGLLRISFQRAIKGGVFSASEKKAYAAFCRQQAFWLEDYALYMALKGHFKDLSWDVWDDDIRLRMKPALRHYRKILADEIVYHSFVQSLFFKQWRALKSYAAAQGIRIIGDLPIYVAYDSADTWSRPDLFQLEWSGRPDAVAGCPPDAFSATGQLWGNPLYDWDRMKADGYGWWIRRIEGATRLYDVLRIDHFRGLDSYWAVPYGDTTAKNGKWRPGPGMSLVGVLTSWFHDTEFIAEDLGYLTPSVRKLLKDSGLPGMKVMEFAFDAHGESDYLPHRCNENSVCYLGTHDNDTVLGWLETTGKEDRDFARRYMHITAEEGWCWGMIRSGMATASVLFVVQMQDLLELGHAARMNTPGQPTGNWRWRMKPDALDPALANKLRLYTETFRRL